MRRVHQDSGTLQQGEEVWKLRQGVQGRSLAFDEEQAAGAGGAFSLELSELQLKHRLAGVHKLVRGSSKPEPLLLPPQSGRPRPLRPAGFGAGWRGGVDKRFGPTEPPGIRNFCFSFSFGFQLASEGFRP